MKVTAYINGFSSGRSAKDATFAITMHSINGTHQNTIPIKDASINETELYALKYIINAIDMDLSEVDLIIHTSNAYTYGMFYFEDGKWVSKPKRNYTLVKEIRVLLEQFSSFVMKMDRHSKTIELLTKRSKTLKTKLKELQTKESVS